MGDTQSHSDADINAAQSWEFTLADFGGEAELGPGFDHYVELRGQNTGSARWASLDYAKLDVTPGANRDLIITDIAVDSSSSDVTFSFQSVVGRTYAIDRSTTMLPSGQPGGWLEITNTLVAESETETYIDSGVAETNGKFFYRVRLVE